MTMFRSSPDRGCGNECELVPNYAWRNSKDKTHVVIPVKNNSSVVELPLRNSRKTGSV